MRRMILILTVLAFAMPVMAGVTITAVNEGVQGTEPNQYGQIRIEYATDANVSAFALEFEFSNGATVNDVCDYFVGECNSTQKGFGIFLDQTNGITISSAGIALDYGKPIVHASSPDGTGTGRGKSKIILEMGALYEDGNQPALGGTLCRITYNSCNDCTLTVATNATRGGVVLADATAASVSFMPVAGLALADTNCPVTSCIVPDVVDTTQAAASAAIVAAGLVVGNVTTANSGTIVAGNVISQNPAATTSVDCGSAVDLVISLGPAECMTSGHMTPDYSAMGGNPAGAYSDYTDWVAVEKPDCWCASGPPDANPRQCWGDADKFAETRKSWWVSTQDLTVLLAAWNKPYIDVGAGGIQGQTVTVGVAPNDKIVPLICADFDHFGETRKGWRVSTYDLNILLAGWNKDGLPLPTCP